MKTKLLTRLFLSYSGLASVIGQARFKRGGGYRHEDGKVRMTPRRIADLMRGGIIFFGCAREMVMEWNPKQDGVPRAYSSLTAFLHEDEAELIHPMIARVVGRLEKQGRVVWRDETKVTDNHFWEGRVRNCEQLNELLSKNGLPVIEVEQESPWYWLDGQPSSTLAEAINDQRLPYTVVC